MTLRECYDLMGGDYGDVMSRLPREQTVQKFVLKFMDDQNFALLKDSMASGDLETAFRAAHTIKGNCQNLSFAKLGESSSELTEALRAGDLARAEALMPRFAEDYRCTMDAIRQLKDSLEG